MGLLRDVVLTRIITRSEYRRDFEDTRLSAKVRDEPEEASMISVSLSTRMLNQNCWKLEEVATRCTLDA